VASSKQFLTDNPVLLQEDFQIDQAIARKQILSTTKGICQDLSAGYYPAEECPGTCTFSDHLYFQSSCSDKPLFCNGNLFQCHQGCTAIIKIINSIQFDTYLVIA